MKQEITKSNVVSELDKVKVEKSKGHRKSTFKDEDLKRMLLLKMATSSDEKSGKKMKIDASIAEMLTLVSTEKEMTKEGLAEDIMSFYFKKLYNLKLSDKMDDIELNNIEIIDIKSDEKINRVTQNIKMKKNIAKVLKFTSVKDAISQGEVFENASRYYFNEIYNRSLKDKIDKIESGEIKIIDID